MMKVQLQKLLIFLKRMRSNTSATRLAKSPDFLTFLLIKILLNSGADFKDFLLISPDFRNFEEF